MFNFGKSKLKNQKHCSILPEAMGEKVIKIALQPNKQKGETARAILFVTPNGFVREHSHAVEDKKPDSEIYINLLEIAKNGMEKITAMPEVAGNNSPTGRLKHGIDKKPQPQVYLAIKKGQEQGAWQNLSTKEDLQQYMLTLRFGCSIVGDNLNIVSRGAEEHDEFVVLDLTENKVSYLSSNKANHQDSIHETTSLSALTNPQKDFGREM